MLFMVIEHFGREAVIRLYRRVRDHGRGLPDGLTYVDSWVEPGFGRCFQLMECDDVSLLQQWALQFAELDVTFEFVPVLPSAQARENVAPYLDQG
jgi:hypothetical protein